MTTIDDLFDCVLEEIFTKLPFHDRLKCKRVCQRWYRILMESFKFRKDRHIRLKNCKLQNGLPPVSVLMNAMRPYQILTIGWNVSYESTLDLMTFTQQLWNNVSEITFNHSFQKFYQILNNFPLVKTLNVNDGGISDFAAYLILARNNEPDALQLETLNLSISYCDTVGTINKSLSIIKFFTSGETKIFLKSVYVRDQDQIDDILPLMEAANVKNLNINAEGKPYKEMKKLIEATNFECKHLTLKFSVNQSPYTFVRDLLVNHSSIETVKLECCSLPPAFELPKITELTLTLQEPVLSLKPLNMLINLKSLDLFYKDQENDFQGCGFGHNAVTLDCLDTLQVKTSWFCHACVEALSASFTNLKTLYLICSTPDILQKILKSWKYLMKVELWADEPSASPEGILGELNVVNDIVTDFQLKFDEKQEVTIDLIDKLSKALPNLQKLSLASEESPLEFEPSIISIIHASLHKFRKIFNVFINGCDQTLNKCQLLTLSEILLVHGYPVENLNQVLNYFDVPKTVYYVDVELSDNPKSSTIDIDHD